MPALGQSVSFGRFMTESLDWEKWSSFSQNRYVEEAERYSKPGSVAQKKAFFEAHYKNLAAKKKAEAEAAALLEQQSKAQEQEILAVLDSEPVVDSNPDVVLKTEESASVLDSIEKETEFSEAVKVEHSNSKVIRLIVFGFISFSLFEVIDVFMSLVAERSSSSDYDQEKEDTFFFFFEGD